MERYLDEELLAKAIGGSQNLPSQQDLSKLIADTEVSLLANNGKASKKLIEIGWYLFTIASIKKAYELYGSERQRAAFQVAGHIFDLALVSGIDGSSEKLRLVFASQIAYLKSQHQPNAIAIRKKHLKTLDKYELSPENYKDISLNSGVALLAFDIGYIYDATRGMENQATQLARNWNVNSLFDTPFGAALGLGIGCHSLISYLR